MKNKMFVKYFIAVVFCLNLANVVATNSIDSLKREIKQTHDFHKKSELLYQLGAEYYASNPDTAFIISGEALELSSDKDIALQAKIHKLRADAAIEIDSVQLAVSEYIIAEQLMVGFNVNSKMLLETYVSLGNIYIQRDNLPEALETYNKAVAISKTGSDTLLLPRLYNNLGIINLYINNSEKALELYTKALGLFKKWNDTMNIAGTTTNIGSIYIELGKFDVARSYYQEGFKIFESIGMMEGEAHALLKLGLLEVKLKNYDKALIYINQSLDIQQNLGKTYSGVKSIFLAETLITKGIILFNLNEIDSSYTNLIKGYNISVDNNDIGLLSEVSEYLSKYFEVKGKINEALDYQKLFKMFSDSINSQSSVRKLTQLEMQLQYEEKLHTNQLENEAKLREEQRVKLYSILAASIFLLGIALLFVLLRLEQNKKKKISLERENLEEKLEHTNKELTTYVMYLLRKNEFIISISEKLKEAKIQAKAENKQRISELIRELDQNSKMFSWDEFEVRFQQVYTGFYKNLNEKYPNLTPNEVRLCAFAKLNMTTKEIAAITYQSVNSISVARYRLRKKMGLNSDESLYSLLADL